MFDGREDGLSARPRRDGQPAGAGGRVAVPGGVRAKRAASDLLGHMRRK